MSDINISYCFAEPGKYTVRGEPKVIVRDYISLSCVVCGKPIFGIDASFDFTKLPIEYHQWIIGLIKSSGANLCNFGRHPDCKAPQKQLEEPKPKIKWWKSIFG